MSNIGWVRIHRKLTDGDFWLSEKFTKPQAWVDLVVNTNHKDGSFWVRGNEIVVLRGQIGWSEVTMARRWKWSRNKVRGFLAQLEKKGKIGQQKIFKLTSVITIINYDKYQSEGQQTEQQTIQQKDNRLNTNKNDKNDKNEKNTIKSDSKESDQTQIIYDNYLKEFGANGNQYKLTSTRKAKIKARIKDAGEEMLLKAIRNVSQSDFHRGDNDRNWKADLDFIIRSYEQVEKLSNLNSKEKVVEFTL